ncbi:MAG: PSD1 and planctomycete cytochrome C domain-containing protein [Pirellulales bacterium]
MKRFDLAVFSGLAAILSVATISTAICHGAEPATANPPKFETHIRPIFREYCFDCHGAAAKLEANLDLRLVRFLEKGGDSGPAIVRGDAAHSHLIELVASGDMPPGEARVPAEKVEVLKAWIAAGAPTLRTEPESIGPGVPISDEDRSYWAYQPIQSPGIPAPTSEESGADRDRTPIDTLLRRAMPKGLSFAPDADRLTLIKRAHFDLIGLPPDDHTVARWMNDPNDGWFDAMIDSLLESPHYGERWARHWLDVAGYADSEGQTIADADRPWAWKYRDYVIRAFNQDKPFDRFITEQLAGDELAGPQNGDWSAEQIELLTATGFLRMAADGTGSGDNSPDARNKVIADTLKIVGNSLMAASLNCAQCHDHRYDPISQIDYTAIRSVFEPAFDWQQWRQPGQRLVSLYTTADRAEAERIEKEAQAIAAEKNTKQSEYMKQALDKELMKYEEPLRAELRTAYETPDKDRSEVQKELLKKYPSVNISPGVLYQYLPTAAEELKKFDARMEEARKKKPVEEFLSVLNEVPNKAPVAKLFHRGDHQQPQQDVVPAGLTVAAPEGKRPEFPEDDPNLPTSGRRLAFAKWLSAADNPLTTRALVNRVWLHHFGKGIVATPGDFGRLGSTPTHPELLDWLSAEFIRNGWSLKGLHRVIMKSTAWRQSALNHPASQQLDPDNYYYSRRGLLRLEAEIIRDRMLAAAGGLSNESFGPPAAIKEDDAGQVIVDGMQTRRSLYVRVKRTQPVAMLQSFDAPVMDINCEARSSSTVATQSLMLLNGEFTVSVAEKMAERAVREAITPDAAWIAQMPKLPASPTSAWTFGSGRFDEAAQRVVDFAPLAHWTGSQWQGGPNVPSERTGWALLHAAGGHPGNPQFATVRRWIVPQAGKLHIEGELIHHSENGDGVRARVVSDRQGLLVEGRAKKCKAECCV